MKSFIAAWITICNDLVEFWGIVKDVEKEVVPPGVEEDDRIGWLYWMVDGEVEKEVAFAAMVVSSILSINADSINSSRV